MPEAKLATHGVGDGWCECGCGQRTKLAGATKTALGHVKGKPYRFVCGHSLPDRPPLESFYVVDESGCWVWTGSVNRAGYGEIQRKGSAERRAHRFVYAHHRGAIPAGMNVHHLCENRLCVNPDHLKVLPPNEHSRLHARAKFDSTLNPERVREIRNRAARGHSTRTLAREFGVTHQSISSIIHRRTWADVT
jgi:hypothetical protein